MMSRLRNRRFDFGLSGEIRIGVMSLFATVALNVRSDMPIIFAAPSALTHRDDCFRFQLHSVLDECSESDEVGEDS